MSSSGRQTIGDLFEVSPGHQLKKDNLVPADSARGIAYVSRTHRRNGIEGWTEALEGLEPAKAGSISVCLRSRNHSLATFVQPFDFYTSYHVAVLHPKEPTMVLGEKLWWCRCIQQNRFRFNFGRQANRTLASLLVPAEVPEWVARIETPEILSSERPTRLDIDPSGWKLFHIAELFELVLGRHDVRRALGQGSTRYVSATAETNGISGYVNARPDFNGGQISVANNGSIGAAFYQPDPFASSIDVTVLVPKFDMSPPAALFICAILRHESRRYNYARKWTLERMKAQSLKLPTDASGDIDVNYMAHVTVASSKFGELIVA